MTAARQSHRSGRGSLRTQLIAWNILALALLLGLQGVVIRYTVSSFLMASIDRDLESMDRHPPGGGPGGNHHRGGPGGPGDLGGPGDPGGPGGPNDGPHGGGPPPGPPPGMSNSFPPGMTSDNGYRLRHFDLQGKSLVSFDPRPPLDPEGIATVAAQGREHYSRILVDGEPVRVLSVPLYEDGKMVGVGQSAHAVADIDRALAVLDRSLLALVPGALLFAGLGGAYLTNRVLYRVRRTAEAAEHISVRDRGAAGLSARLPVIGNDEFSRLAETINGLLDRLEGAFRQQAHVLEQQRRFIADASHELKTPLTVIRGNAEMMAGGGFAPEEYRRSMGEVGRAASLMTRLVQDLLLLARSDEGHLSSDNRTELVVREVIETALSGVPRGAAGNDTPAIDLDVEDETLTVIGNETELVRVFSNLLDNAVRHTPASGRVVVRVSALRPRETDDPGEVVVYVADNGVGIAPEHLPHLGERFYRVDAARARRDGGTGLGLSICKSILEAHGGGLSITSVLGEGTTVTVRLPRAASTAGDW